MIFFPGTVNNRSEMILMEHINEKNILTDQDSSVDIEGRKGHKGKVWWVGEVLEKLLTWVREIPVSLWSFRNKNIFCRGPKV